MITMTLLPRYYENDYFTMHGIVIMTTLISLCCCCFTEVYSVTTNILIINKYTSPSILHSTATVYLAEQYLP